MSLSIRALCAPLCFALFLCVSAFAQDENPSFPLPTEPVLAGHPFSKKSSGPEVAASAPVLFSIGEPSDEEQLYLELANRARSNPNAEVQRLIGLNDPSVQNALLKVDTNLLVSQFSTNPVAPPLSFSAKLLTAARNHSQYQFDNGIQSHIGPGTDGLVDRLEAVNYSFFWATENVYSYAQNAQHGHAGFEIDWSGGTANGGMQTPPGHRDHIHDQRFVEIGIGVVNGTNKVGTNVMVGPQLVTQDFGTPSPAMTYITGVAYYDLNGNNFYDVGEGLSGVPVVVDGVGTYAITSASGGYSVPVPAGNNYTVRFQAAGVSETVASATVSSTNNVKLDYKPPFVAPSVVSAPSVTYAGLSNLFVLSPFAGATSYRARIFTLQPMPLEGAEGPLTNVSLATFGNYTVISTNVKASGNKSFHLGHMTDDATGAAYPQYVQLVKPFYVWAGARIDFKSRLGAAFAGSPQSGPGEIARLEVSIDEGNTWTAIWSQGGTEVPFGADNSEKTFNARFASLSNYVGKLVMVRFNFDVNTSVGWFDLKNDKDKYGWYIDDISISGAEQGVSSTTTAKADGAGNFQFVPPAVGSYAMQFGATAGARDFPMGAWFSVTAQSGPPVISPTEISMSGGSLSMHVVETGTRTLTLQSAPTLAGPWTNETNATVSGSGNEYTLSAPLNGNARFYRVVAN
jgi:uncharacterized protein YkwD